MFKRFLKRLLIFIPIFLFLFGCLIWCSFVWLFTGRDSYVDDNQDNILLIMADKLFEFAELD